MYVTSYDRIRWLRETTRIRKILSHIVVADTPEGRHICYRRESKTETRLADRFRVPSDGMPRNGSLMIASLECENRWMNFERFERDFAWGRQIMIDRAESVCVNYVFGFVVVISPRAKRIHSPAYANRGSAGGVDDVTALLDTWRFLLFPLRALSFCACPIDPESLNQPRWGSRWGVRTGDEWHAQICTCEWLAVSLPYFDYVSF